MSDAIDRWRKEKQNRAAKEEVMQQLVNKITTIADMLRGTKWQGVALLQPDQTALSGASINLRDWPTAEDLHKAKVEWAHANDEQRAAYNGLTQEERADVKP